MYIVDEFELQGENLKISYTKGTTPLSFTTSRNCFLTYLKLEKEIESFDRYWIVEEVMEGKYQSVAVGEFFARPLMGFIQDWVTSMGEKIDERTKKQAVMASIEAVEEQLRSIANIAPEVARSVNAATSVMTSIKSEVCQ